MSAAKQLEDALFFTALHVTDPEQRRLFLDQACLDNAPLRAIVEEMLAAHEDADRLIDCGLNAIALTADDLRELPEAVAFPAGERPDEQIGKRIGRYTILESLGKGGCGAVYLADEAVSLERQGNRIEAVTLAQGGRIACGNLVDSAGYHAHEVAAMAGIELPIRPRKRFVFVFDCKEPVERAPLLIDPSGVYFRPEGANFIGGVSPPEDQGPDCFDFEIDYRLFEEVVWPTLAERVPAFEAIKLVRAWAGHYDYNTLDQNAILGPHPEIRNFYFANGFSGHGLQQSPAAGRATAELIAHGAYRSIDLTRFGYERVLRGEPIVELNVV